MIIALIRAILLYFLVFIAMRVMGKRQLGELQPTELVVTILIAEIATIPMQDNGTPLLNSLIPIGILIALEILMSVISLKSNKLRSLISGHSIIIINDGKIDYNQLKRLRFNVNDITEALRQKDVFHIEEVQYAVVETNGRLSVLLKSQYNPVTVEMMNLSPKQKSLPYILVSDGKIISVGLRSIGWSEKRLMKTLSDNAVELSQILIMTSDKAGNYIIMRKEEIGH